MQGYLACAFIATQEALLIVHPYNQLLLAVIFSSLTNHAM
jgi:hypothetical protein